MIQKPLRPLMLLPLLFGMMLAGCEHKTVPAPSSDVVHKQEVPKLRILRSRQAWGMLPGNDLKHSEELKLAEEFAASVGMELEYVFVDRDALLIDHLLRGEGDLVINNLTVSPSRKRLINFTSPLTYISELIIARKGNAPKRERQLRGRRIAVHASSPYYETLQELQTQHKIPAFEIQLVDESIPTEAILIGVAEGVYDLAIADNQQYQLISNYYDNLEIGFDLGIVRAIAWGVHPDNSSLLGRLNGFLGQHHLASQEKYLANDDLLAIKQRGVLRVLTRNTPTTYFLWRGEISGFEYELARRFAKQQGLRLEMVVPPSREMLLPWLREGKGDIIAASLPINDSLEKQGLRFSRPYNQSSEIVISRSNEKGLANPQSLSGRTVAVHRSSTNWHILEKLQEQGIGLTLQAAPEELEASELIARVASGRYDLTVANSHILDIALTWRDDIKAAFPLEEPRQQGWLVRENNPQLLHAVNDFFQKEYQGPFYNVTYRKYFKNPRRSIQQAALKSGLSGNPRFSPYDEQVQKYAKEYGFDWRLIIAQMYQESRFDPGAKSWMGARGLMQVMPQTAKELGLEDLHHPETGLHAGIKYLNWMMSSFEPEMALADRTWFALAAYNAGIGHVIDARLLAEQLGLDPNQWFENVEKAMLLLSKNKYAKNARHGYVRGYEPVKYVREIRDRYRAYLRLAANTTTAVAHCAGQTLC